VVKKCLLDKDVSFGKARGHNLMRLQGRLWEDRRERVVLGREEASFPQLSNYKRGVLPKASRHP
jgi:hypothetical protein